MVVARRCGRRLQRHFGKASVVVLFHLQQGNARADSASCLDAHSFSQAEENALMAKLTLHGVYGRFRADMFLSSLTESSLYPSLNMLTLK